MKLTLDNWSQCDERKFMRRKRKLMLAMLRDQEQENEIQIEQLSYNDYITNNV